MPSSARKVPSPTEGQRLVSKIKHYHEQRAHTPAQIARELELDPRTVAKWLAERGRFCQGHSHVRKQKEPAGCFPTGSNYGGLGRRRPTLPRGRPRSTIGAEELNDRVRDGNGCGLLAGTTGPKTEVGGRNTQSDFSSPTSDFGSRIGVSSRVSRSRSIAFFRMVKPHGPLGSVSSTHYCAYTPDLSTL